MALLLLAGFAFYLRDNARLGHEALLAARNQLLDAASRSPLMVNVRPNGLEDMPKLRIEIDDRRAAALGLATTDINAALATAWGSQYIDDFIDRGRVKRFYVQADAEFRMKPEDFRRWSVRNEQGEMVPFSDFGRARWDYG